MCNIYPSQDLFFNGYVFKLFFYILCLNLHFHIELESFYGLDSQIETVTKRFIGQQPSENRLK